MPDVESSRKKIRQEDVRTTQVADNEWLVYNNKKGTMYSVLRTPLGYWRCTCPFMTHGSRVGISGNCKHIVLVQDSVQ